jgi:thiamine-phosphate pyrophosphorylase
MAEGPQLPPRLVLISPGDLVEPRAVEGFRRLARDLAEAGLAGLLLREPRLGDRALLELGLALRPCLPWLGIHDRVHVGCAAGADAVHLGFRSLEPGAARLAAGDGPTAPRLGLSTHAPDDPAAWAGVDYVFHGPIFETPSKQGLLEPIGRAGLERALAARPDGVPLLALGGITAPEAAGLLAAGADGVAVIGAVLAATDPRAALLDLLAACA